MSKSLPPRPHIEVLRKQAKELARDFALGLAEARRRVVAHHPQAARFSQKLPLQEAQLVLAREYGFVRWPALVAAIQAVAEGDAPLKRALDAADLEGLKALIDAEPGCLRRPFAIMGRRGRVLQVTPLVYADVCESVEAMQMLIGAGADRKELNEALFGTCENHNLEHIERLLTVGVDPNEAYNDGWDCHVLYGLLQTYHRSPPKRMRACVNALIGAGASYEDTPDMDLHRGDLARLEQRLGKQPDLVHRRFDRDYGDHLTLRGATLLNIAVEYHDIDAIDLLLRYGADLDAPAAIGSNGVGGQTPLFHAIGTNQGTGYAVFEYLLGKNPDLTVQAQIQVNDADDGKVMDCVHKGKDHFFDEVRTVTPLAYAAWYEHAPSWRSAAKEAQRLRPLTPNT